MPTDPKDVTEILLAGEWVHVKPGGFAVDSFDFQNPGHVMMLHRAGVGFTAITATDGATISGPINSVQAVKTGTAIVRKARPTTTTTTKGATK